MKIFFPLLFFSASHPTWLDAQNIRHPTKNVHAGCYHCDSTQNWNDIINKRALGSAPYNCIFHLGIKKKNDVSHYGTASFVSKDVLVTARHCLDGARNIEYIELCLNSFKNSWIKLNKKDYQILYYTEEFTKAYNDIALIKIVNKEKLKRLYSGHFEVDQVLDTNNIKEINIAGYPINKFAINSTAPDTLVNRSVHYKLAEFNKPNNMIGLPLCVCNGDSGGPVWICKNNKFFILGVNHGSKSSEDGFTNPKLNTSVLINNNVAKWIIETIATSAK